MGFAVARTARRLVRPAAPAPYGALRLSVIDRVPGLRHMVRSLHVFKGRDRSSAAAAPSPAEVIGDALGKALVEYYPFAGRFAGEEEVRVECTGEGAWFVEAAAECELEEVKYLDHPMMISPEELLPEAEGMTEEDPFNVPLFMQVTEFKCGGFVVGLISIHTIADGLGAAQFINAVGDLARGLDKPTIEPVWARDMIPSPPPYPPVGPPALPTFKLEPYTTDLGPGFITKVKAHYFESTAQRCSTFDVVVAKTWQARTRSIGPGLGPDEPVTLCFFANCRHLLVADGLSKGQGFYGNCFYPVSVESTAGAVAGTDVAGVVGIVRGAKARLAADVAQWATGEFRADPFVLSFGYRMLFVSDWTRLGFLEADYGWGRPASVVPFAYVPAMAVAIITAPPAPKKGVRVMTQCVEKEHLSGFRAEMLQGEPNGPIVD